LENENKNNNEKQEAKQPAEINSNEIQPSIFLKEEIVATVRSFVLAWLKNDIKIHFPTADGIRLRAKEEGERIDAIEANRREADGKIAFLNKIVLLSGTVPATKEQQDHTITELFKDILCYRCGNRIEGTFGKKDELDARLSRVEEQLGSMNNTIQQLIIWYRSLLPH
jgi:hypothetical protein